ncbi:ATP-dependent helicase, partial [Streptomyces sp. SID9124]|nr:ATP-dependent helicase [Streptomyces sp. SID9124]
MTEGGSAKGAAPAGRAARELLVRADGLLDAARGVLADHTRAVTAVRTCLDPLLDGLVRADLAAIPVARLKDVTEGRLRLGAIEQAGLTTVGQVYGAGRYELRQIPGVGAQTADQALAAAGQIAHAVRDTVALRIDVDARDEAVTALLGALYRLVEAGPDVRRAVDGARALAERLEPLLTAAGPA